MTVPKQEGRRRGSGSGSGGMLDMGGGHGDDGGGNDGQGGQSDGSGGEGATCGPAREDRARRGSGPPSPASNQRPPAFAEAPPFCSS